MQSAPCRNVGTARYCPFAPGNLRHFYTKVETCIWVYVRVITVPLSRDRESIVGHLRVYVHMICNKAAIAWTILVKVLPVICGMNWQNIDVKLSWKLYRIDVSYKMYLAAVLEIDVLFFQTMQLTSSSTRAVSGPAAALRRYLPRVFLLKRRKPFSKSTEVFIFY